MLITFFVDLTELISWIVIIGVLLLLLGLWLICSIFEGIGNWFGERKRKRQYEEYDRKFGEGSEEDVDSGVDPVGGGSD